MCLSIYMYNNVHICGVSLSVPSYIDMKTLHTCTRVHFVLHYIIHQCTCTIIVLHR